MHRHDRLMESLEDRRLFAVPAALGGTDRVAMDLSADWKFIRSDVTNGQQAGLNTNGWSDIDLPHTFNATDGANGGDDYYKGGTWYRREFTPRKQFTGRRVYLNVGAAATKADVYVNGNYAGTHEGANTAFTIDVTGYLQRDKTNVIAIRVDNTKNPSIPGFQGDWTNFGGLTRGVQLFATPKLAVNPADLGSSGVKITQRNVSSSKATLDIDVSVRNADKKNQGYTLRTTLVDTRGRIVKQGSTNFTALKKKARTFEQTLTIKNPHLWNGTADPFLYTAYTQVLIGGVVYDTVATKVGIRSVQMTANGLQLNGQSLFLKGVNLHDDKQGVGTAMTDADRDRDVKLLKELGANAVRFAHWQVDQDWYDEMDRLGILVWTEIPVWRSVTETNAYATNAETQMRELIRQSINHASIFTWGIFNEVQDNANVQSLLNRVNNVAHAEDPSRFTIGASELNNGATINTIPDVVTFNKYFGWYGNFNEPGPTRVNRLGPFLEDQHAAAPSMPVGLGEFGAGANITQHVDDPTSGAPASDPNSTNFHPEEYQSLVHELSWNEIENANVPVFGAFIWQFADSGNDKRNEGGQQGSNDKGLLTYDRNTAKDAFYYYKSQWNDSPMIYLTSKRYTTRTSSTANVKVYSNLGTTAELLINGQSVGSRSDGDSVLEWDDVPLAVGKNVVVVRSTKNGVTYTDTTTWTRTGSSSGQAAAYVASATSEKRRDDLFSADHPIV